MLLAGFQATNLGTGAICVTCHNSRRGLHNDAVFSTLYGTADATRGPHEPTQADVYMGQNAYNVAVGQRGAHANLPDGCIACHMQATPPPPGFSYNQSGTNHTFGADPAICADCHSGLTAAEIQGPFDTKMATLLADINDAFVALFDAQIAAGNTINVNNLATLAATSDYTAVVFVGGSRQSVDVTLADGTVLEGVQLNNISTVAAGGTATPIYYVAPHALVKATWNYLLFTQDLSRGVHNPGWTMTALDATISALQNPPAPCVDDGDTLCLNDNRFQVEVTWTDYQGNTGAGQVGPCGSENSGLFYFFTPDNWEMLIKVLDGCGVNQNYWVYFAATTDVEFVTTVTDTQTGAVKTYTNALGHPANAVTDATAFPACP